MDKATEKSESLRAENGRIEALLGKEKEKFASLQTSSQLVQQELNSTRQSFEKEKEASRAKIEEDCRNFESKLAASKSEVSLLFGETRKVKHNLPPILMV